MIEQPTDRAHIPAEEGLAPRSPEERAERRRLRRERLRQRLAETTVASPCVGICQIDETSSFCIGCLRTIDEIRDWMILDDDEKRAVLARLDQAAR